MTKISTRAIMAHPAILIFFFISYTAVEAVFRGQDVVGNKFPYIVSLQVMNDKDELEDFCGGAIIKEDVILTATHCLIRSDGIDIDDMIVVAGTIDKTKRDKDFTFKIDTKHVYHYGQSHDFSLFKLDGKIPIGDRAKIVKLPTSQPKLRASFTLAGWGLTEKKRPTNILQKLPQSIQGTKICIAESDEDEPFIEGFQFCTHGKDYTSGCDGDSGSPFVSLSDGVLVGIQISTVTPCGKRDTVDFYANVFAYKDFISNCLKKIEKDKKKSYRKGPRRNRN